MTNNCGLCRMSRAASSSAGHGASTKGQGGGAAASPEAELTSSTSKAGSPFAVRARPSQCARIYGVSPHAETIEWFARRVAPQQAREPARHAGNAPGVELPLGQQQAQDSFEVLQRNSGLANVQKRCSQATTPTGNSHFVSAAQTRPLL